MKSIWITILCSLLIAGCGGSGSFGQPADGPAGPDGSVSSAQPKANSYSAVCTEAAIPGTPDPDHPEVEITMRYALPDGADWPLPVVVYTPAFTYNKTDHNPCDPTTYSSTYSPTAVLKGIVAAGYALVTYDDRGHACETRPQLCSNSYFGHPDYEVQDMKLILDWVAEQPWSQLDGRGDPRVALYARSKGTLVAMNTTIHDRRVDAVIPEVPVPDFISAMVNNGVEREFWHTFVAVAAQGWVQFSPAYAQDFAIWGAGGPLSDQLKTLFWDISPLRYIDNGFVTPDRRSEFNESRVPFRGNHKDKPTLFMVSNLDSVASIWPIHEYTQHISAPYKLFGFNEYHDEVLVPIRANPRWGRDCLDESCFLPCGDKLSAILPWLDRHLRGLDVNTGPRYEFATDTLQCATPDELVDLTPFSGPGPYDLHPIGNLDIPIITAEELEARGLPRTLVGLPKVSFEVDDVDIAAVMTLVVTNSSDPSRTRTLFAQMTPFDLNVVAEDDGGSPTRHVRDLPMGLVGTVLDLAANEQLSLRVQYNVPPHYVGRAHNGPVNFYNVELKLPLQDQLPSTGPGLAAIPVPTELQSGDHYQLLFHSSVNNMTAESADISDYNAWVQSLADEAGIGGNIGITWRAIVSTASIDARDNALVEAPVYNMRSEGPERLADGFDDMWDGALASGVLLTYTETGGQSTSDVWTGSLRSGVGAPGLTLGSFPSAICGSPEPVIEDDWIEFLPPPVGTELGMYALSEVLVVP